ncbi:hypothetical protein BW054_004783 [Salmonella enterica subsp. enterica serovar Javiana]|uniref:Uncharacterized protein n=25 Tax=Enterobacteriaceae TaxID=543 RepID=A0A4S1MI25_ECOLX|nr:hypothetical protein CHC58_25330 [Salmonella enterica]AYN87804.1 hypothetical protein EAH50_00260 [Escherichia coli]EAA1025790.1 hypothetical protein [Salmonella enterica subsp. enterica serovar Saintpaul]EAA4206884.1 hypothetical protein [Salmonella enterica subsp. enterica serovar Schwarzengrund]EAA6414541.1 hypothetical protein [Salmonella enterica subsp. enterica serovar Typhimurium]EAA7974393.1 hypothetical protein [Salmonella enterica subsp. enterica serovar 4,[5],12:i:-]EAV4988970.1
MVMFVLVAQFLLDASSTPALKFMPSFLASVARWEAIWSVICGCLRLQPYHLWSAGKASSDTPLPGAAGAGGVFTPCVCCNGIFSGNRESNFFDIFLLYVPAFHTKVKFALLSENLKRTDRVL